MHSPAGVGERKRGGVRCDGHDFEDQGPNGKNHDLIQNERGSALKYIRGPWATDLENISEMCQQHPAAIAEEGESQEDKGKGEEEHDDRPHEGGDPVLQRLNVH